MKIGFVGLGQMGKPIAFNLLKSRAELLVNDRSDQWFDAFCERGARGTTEIADLAETDIIFLCLPSANVVQAVLLGDGGLLPRLNQSQIVVDLSHVYRWPKGEPSQFGETGAILRNV